MYISSTLYRLIDTREAVVYSMLTSPLKTVNVIINTFSKQFDEAIDILNLG